VHDLFSWDCGALSCLLPFCQPAALAMGHST
jgi:hypothetical protein